MSRLRYDRVDALPLIHGRLAFALEARRCLLEHRYAAIAVELPPSLERAVQEGVDALPRAQLVVYREQPEFLDATAPSYFVPIQPGDGIVEALRICRGERIPARFVDAEVEAFHDRPVFLPDPHSLHTLGLEGYFEACSPAVAAHPRQRADDIREAHMAWRLRGLLEEFPGRILFICGLAHWDRVRRHLEQGTEAPHEGEGVPPEQVQRVMAGPGSLPLMFGTELPFVIGEYEKHRSGLELDDFDPARALTRLLLRTREAHRRRFPGALETGTPHSLRTLLRYARKLTVRKGFLLPDPYTLTVAAKGVVGNDFALVLVEEAHRYPWNPPLGVDSGIDDRHGEGGETEAEEGFEGEEPMPVWFTDEGACTAVDERPVPLLPRVAGTASSFGKLRLERRPDPRRRQEWRRGWEPTQQCSWPPEDLVIEGFRDYVGKRALSLARVARQRIHPFTASFLDGIDIRETLRDVVERRIFVREEPRAPGGVGALVVIFEEDDFGVRYPWRTTWMAEHPQESTLVFYATDFKENVIGPGVARATYGGCLLVFPPKWIPDVWDDLRFERARTPSERLLLAAIYWSAERYIVHVASRPASPEVQAEAHRRGKHILTLPLSTFSRSRLERIRRVHVLNGQHVRTYAHRFIR